MKNQYWAVWIDVESEQQVAHMDGGYQKLEKTEDLCKKKNTWSRNKYANVFPVGERGPVGKQERFFDKRKF